MNQNQGKSHRTSGVLSGKGFYMVLALCLVLLGASGFALYRSAAVTPAAEVSQPEREVTVTPALPDEQETMEDSDVQIEVSRPVLTPEPETVESAGIAQTVDAAEPEEAVETAAPAEITVSAPAEEETEETVETAAPVEETASFGGLLWPVDGEVVTAFSATELIYHPAMGDWRTHGGVDLAASLGSEVLCAMDGVVETVADDPITGVTVTVAHAESLETVYGNLDPATLNVAVGDAISAGSSIACVGSSAVGEAADTPCLHFAVLAGGQPVNPLDYLE